MSHVLLAGKKLVEALFDLNKFIVIAKSFEFSDLADSAEATANSKKPCKIITQVVLTNYGFWIYFMNWFLIETFYELDSLIAFSGYSLATIVAIAWDLPEIPRPTGS